MPSSRVFLFLFFCVNSVFSQGVGSGTNGNLRLCVVESRGQYKRAAKFCPVLDEAKVGIECVLGTDRLDCLRRMGKGTVDFGVFNPEDLIAAQWAQIDVLVTNELRKTQTKFERNVVAVVNRRIIPEGSSTVGAILRNRTLCHAGLESDPTQPLSDKLSEYLEGLVTEKLCDENLSMAENRIKAMAEYYGKACKASNWIDDKERDLELKSKYPSLCAACARSCNRYDRYFGKVGSLLCLSEGSGDVAFADHTYVRLFAPLTMSPNFAYLCRDGTSQPLNTTEPCVWLNKPWPVIVAKRKTAAAVGNLTRSLIDKNVTVQGNWHSALAALFESNRALPEPLQPPHAPLDYLDSAVGYREAYSQNGCTPPRHLRVCTTSVLEKHKCDWLSEAAAVHGVEPPLQCESRGNRRDCLRAVGNGTCDVTMADSDWLVVANRDFSVMPLLHETTPIVERMSTVVAYVKRNAQINKMADLRGKRAAFPRYDGFAWHSVLRYLQKQKICPSDRYFSEICAPGVESYNLPETVKEKLTRNCIVDGGIVLDGEIAALRSLVEGKSDVAFISIATYNMYAAKQIHESWSKATVEIVPVCPEDNKKYCFVSWSNIGHVFASNNVTSMKRHEIKNAFTRLDQLFGKSSPFHWAMFSMYGPFNHQLNVLFHNNTKSLESEALFGTHPYDKLPLNYERDLLNVTLDGCQSDFTQSFAAKFMPTVFTVMLVLVCHFIR